ncbi:HD domain protein [Candidatus Phytoplasma oryzae]|uniref:bis(5'-nucleosyl)-tetraphosphatase (symmetrical) n=1 Tax=Candidatus Phytoplasma oryzae TaxID=203274 RepID=A0A139JQU7_9MOLU|nr:bis(5'-nucleosyl)-tetraphosphatase (symmetrical) YqeK [Candidatus Phytoplasma oryzae]KXT29318.1 HD domain protein [Candidatus Phytoplasma oryzae]RAM57873.1 hypothetical protein DH96_00955 [Candidatus Phytoplasma oryzae]
MLINQIFEKVKKKFQKDINRLNHILGVYAQSIELASFYKIDIQKIKIASLFHDYTKNDSLEFHLSLINEKIIKKYKETPFVYHAFSAAVILQKQFFIKDKLILNAICNHVWGHKNMNLLDKILLVSDKTEINRTYPQVNYLRKLSFQNIDLTIYEILKLNLLYYSKKGFIVHSNFLETLNFFKKIKNKNIL